MTNQPPSPTVQDGEGAAPEPAPAPRKKGGASKVVLTVVSVLAVAALAVVAVLVVRNVLATTDPAKEARQGDCLANLPEAAAGKETDAANVKVVACDSPDARYSVVGRVDGVTAEQAASGEVCGPYLDAGAEMRYYAIPAGGKGYVLCLKPA